MAVDLSQVIALAAFAAAFTGAMLVTGITYFEDRIPECMGKVDVWLEEIQDDLGKEVIAWCETKKEEDGYDQILSVASEFSAVTSMNKQLDFMELRNSRQVKLHMLTVGAIAAAVLVFYDAGAQVPFSSAYDEAFSSATIIAIFAALLWILGLFVFFSLYSDYSKLKRLVRQRVVEPVQES
jgi:hypothetical protein